MIEMVNEKDISNWRWHYKGIQFEDMTGEDLFILSCLDTIEELRSDESKKTLSALLADALMERDGLRMVVSSINAEIDKIIKDGFALMHSINNAITYDNEDEARKGGFGLPVHVVDEMNKFTQLLHDSYDAYPDKREQGGGNGTRGKK